MSKVIAEGGKKLSLCLDCNFKQFLADFYTEALAGILIGTFKESYAIGKEETLQNVMLILKVSIPEVLLAKTKTQSMS